METIALIRTGTFPDLDMYVDRVFKDEDSAHKYANKQTKHVTIVKITSDKKIKTGSHFSMAAYNELKRSRI